MRLDGPGTFFSVAGFSGDGCLCEMNERREDCSSTAESAAPPELPSFQSLMAVTGSWLVLRKRLNFLTNRPRTLCRLSCFDECDNAAVEPFAETNVGERVE